MLRASDQRLIIRQLLARWSIRSFTTMPRDPADDLMNDSDCESIDCLDYIHSPTAAGKIPLNAPTSSVGSREEQLTNEQQTAESFAGTNAPSSTLVPQSKSLLSSSNVKIEQSEFDESGKRAVPITESVTMKKIEFDEQRTRSNEESPLPGDEVTNSESPWAS